MCSLLESPKALFLERGKKASMALNAYPLTWGHSMVVLHEHTTQYASLDPAAFQEAMEMVHKLAGRIEERLTPARVFVASLGSAREGLIMTSPHLHWHVIPVGESQTRAAELLTWERGVLSGTPGEWEKLGALLRP